MKTAFTIHFVFMLFVFSITTGCSNAQNKNLLNSEQNDSIATNKKVLIVYLTRTNNTKSVAELIHTKVGGDLMAIEPKTPYSENYKKNVDEVSFQNQLDILPPLKTIIDISKYDTIFVGFPTWDMQLPPPIKTFLNNSNWKGKTIAPFNTNAGYGLGSSKSQIEKYCLGGNITEILSVVGGHEKEGVMYVMEGEKLVEVSKKVENWLDKIRER